MTLYFVSSIVAVVVVFITQDPIKIGVIWMIIHSGVTSSIIYESDNA